MKITKNIIGGLAGAIALNILHQVAAASIKNAPRLDLVGEEALEKGIKKTGLEPPEANTLTAAALAGDLTANTLYYSLIGEGDDKYLLARGAGYGLIAGIGALSVPAHINLDDEPVNKSTKTKLLTMSWYIFGGLVTAITIKALRKP